MSVTEGVDLALEVIGFIYVSFSSSEHDRPFLRHGNEKALIIPDDTETGIDAIANAEHRTTGYSAALRQTPTVTVEYESNSREAVGTEFDYDTSPQVDVTIEALSGKPSGVQTQLSFRQLVDAVIAAIDDHRTFPLVQLNSRYSYRDLRISDESTNPVAEDNRDWHNTELTVEFRGWEEY